MSTPQNYDELVKHLRSTVDDFREEACDLHNEVSGSFSLIGNRDAVLFARAEELESAADRLEKLLPTSE